MPPIILKIVIRFATATEMGPSSGGGDAGGPRQAHRLTSLLLTLLVAECCFVACCHGGGSTIFGLGQLENSARCSPDAPLKTKNFYPFYEAVQQVKGCATSETTSNGLQVHVVRIDTTSKYVHLDLDQVMITDLCVGELPMK